MLLHQKLDREYVCDKYDSLLENDKMAARKAVAAEPVQTVDIAALYDEVETGIVASSKEFGKYLPFKWYREEVAACTKMLVSKRGHATTSEIRQFVTLVLTKKIEAMPEGADKVMDNMGKVREEVTKSELKARLTARLEASKKSSNNGPTITRSLCSPSNKDWLKKNHGITCENGVWNVLQAKQEEESS